VDFVSAMKRIDQYWYSRNSLAIALLPLSLLFRIVSFLRWFCYRTGICTIYKLSVPVIVVGNINVGGTGKTPLVIWLANFLKKEGLNPGIISRGYGGRAQTWPQQVNIDSDPQLVGDEAILLARRTLCPIAVAPKRVAAATALIQQEQCDLIISDDGLQHYALHRDLEIAVVDGVRRFGNGFHLPAGPLRESEKRLQSVDFIVANGASLDNEYAMTLEGIAVINVRDGQRKRSLFELKGEEVHAVAGIGNPDRFFSYLRFLGMTVIEHPFPDHYAYTQKDLNFNEEQIVVMTEKDAVKCTEYCHANSWYVAVEARMEPEFLNRLRDKIKQLRVV